MKCKENILLSSLTTFRVGGAARYVIECVTIEDVREALMFARERSLSYMVIGQGSNILADDEGYDGLILQMVNGMIRFPENTLLIADAGVSWDAVVTEACERKLWGLENLAGIPGTAGASPVQNIGAYGSEVADCIEWVEVLDPRTNQVQTLSMQECEFAYRTSIFKHEPYIIIRVAYRLSIEASPKVSYADLQAVQEKGVPLTTPSEIAEAVRTIRAYKFPDLRISGTAGSFFKNPIVSDEHFAELKMQYPDLPGYSATTGVKVSLAWIFDKVLHLNGYTLGAVRHFERQPLVIVAEKGATKKEVDALADESTARVFATTKINIEREVRALTKNFL